MVTQLFPTGQSAKLRSPEADRTGRPTQTSTLNEHSDPNDTETSSPARTVWPLLIPILLAVATFVFLRSAVQSEQGQDNPAVGKPAPQLDLVLMSDDGTLDPLQTIAGGDVTLLHFWGTWCGPCRMEYPELADVTARLTRDPQFRFVSISCEGGGGETIEGLWSKTDRFLRSAGVADRTAFADPRGVTRRSVAERLERESMFYPTSILVDADGVIAGVWEGYEPGGVDEIEQVSNRLLARGSN